MTQFKMNTGKDFSLVLMLLVLLMNDGADETLIMALLYILT